MMKTVPASGLAPDRGRHSALLLELAFAFWLIEFLAIVLHTWGVAPGCASGEGHYVLLW